MNNKLSNVSNNIDNELQADVEDKLSLEEKLRIVKGLLLLFLFSSVVISSMYYYNAPNYNPNLVFAGTHDEHMRHDKHTHENPVYRLQSKFTKKNVIDLELKLERVGKNNIIDTETIRNLMFSIKFAKNKAKIEISDLDHKLNEFKIPNSLYDFNDFELEDDGRIKYLEESNIGIHIVNHPFSFYLYRKETGERLFDTTHSNESKNPAHYLYYAKNYIQISTALPQNHYTYGFGERFGSLLLKKGKYVLWAMDSYNGKPVDSESYDNSYSSIPSYITVNPKTLNSYGAIMLNSSPMEVLVEEDYLTYKMTSGSIELYVFNGPRPKEIIMQMQQTIGMPILPEFSAINWQANLITSVPNRDIVSLNQLLAKENNYKYPIVDVWVDYDIPIEESLYEFKDLQDEFKTLEQNNHKIHSYSRSPIAKNYDNFEIALNNTVCIKNENNEIFYGKTSYGDVCFMDYMSPYALPFVMDHRLFNKELNTTASKMILMMNEPSHNCVGECESTTGNTSDMKLPFVPGGINLEQGTLPLKAKQYSQDVNGNSNIMLNTHNIYSLQETKTYFTALNDHGVNRPLLFSRSFFPGVQQYAGKWLGYIEGSWDGLRLAMLQTISFNLYGNPNVAHEACGYSKYSPNPDKKITQKEKDSKYSEELCIRWLQFSSMNPLARLNDFEILPYYKESNKKAVESAFKLRSVLNMYIYAYMLKNAISGGSFIRPIFLDFKSENMIDELHEIDSQVMLGSHIMMSPVISYNQRKKRTYFPQEKFYDFYTGLFMNPNGEQFISVDAPLDRLPLFARAGFVTPLQSSPENLTDLNQMRRQPVELLIALDSNFRAAGRIYIDDGKTKRTVKKRDFFRMDVTALQDASSQNVEIIFYKFPYEFNIIDGEYPFISKLHIFGLDRKPTRIYQSLKIEGRNSISDIPSKSIVMDNDTNALYVTDLKLSLEPENTYKLIIE